MLWQACLILTGRIPLLSAGRSSRHTSEGLTPLLLLGFGLMLFGFIGWVIPGQGVLAALRSQSWPRVSALVTQAQYGNRCALLYTYTVDDMKYTGKRTGWETISPGRYGDADCEALRGQPHLRVGEVIQVAYNPDDPAQSVVRTAVPSSSIQLMLLTSPFLTMLAWGLRRAWREATRPQGA
nr:DUF3592 domain-containing protein [Deinococcus radiotolerans]